MGSADFLRSNQALESRTELRVVPIQIQSSILNSGEN